MKKIAEPLVARAYEGQIVNLMARIKKADATSLVQSDFTGTITRKVFDLSSATPIAGLVSDSLTVASYVYNSLQTDGRWTVDSTGYNFRDAVPAAKLPSGNKRYLVQYQGTVTTEGVVVWEFFVDIVDLYGS